MRVTKLPLSSLNREMISSLMLARRLSGLFPRRDTQRLVVIRPAQMRGHVIREAPAVIEISATRTFDDVWRFWHFFHGPVLHMQVTKRQEKPQISADWQKSRTFLENGGAEGDRTPDLVIANDALSQLSYGPKERCL
jgi:hypothetical protein